MSDIDERLEEEIIHAFRKSFDSQQAGINANFLMDIQREIERLRADLAAVTEERDALAARLAPVDDEALVEIAMQAAYKAEYGEDMSVEQAETNFVESIYKPIMTAIIAAIRPHIEAAERERCAKELTEARELLHKLTAIIPGNDGAGEEVAKFLRDAAIRRST